MGATRISPVSEAEFSQRHNYQRERPGKDVFLVWFALMFVAVVGAHFVLNFSPGTPTGFVTASQDAVENLSLLVDSFFVLFVTVLVGILAYWGITKDDY